jgi:hypothetical protein
MKAKNTPSFLGVIKRYDNLAPCILFTFFTVHQYSAKGVKPSKKGFTITTTISQPPSPLFALSIHTSP